MRLSDLLRLAEKEALKEIAKRLGPTALGDALSDALLECGLPAEGYAAAKEIVRSGAVPETLADLLLLQLAENHKFDREAFVLATLDECYGKPLRTGGAWDLFWKGVPKAEPEILRVDDLLDLEIEPGQGT